MPEKNDKNWTIQIPIADRVHAVQFCQWPWTTNLLLVGTNLRVIAYSVKFKEEDPDIKDIKYEKLREFNHGSPVQAIAWSPETSLTVFPKTVRFATAGKAQIHIFSSDLKSNESLQVLEGHTDYINSIAYDEETSALASCSDDNTCRLWAKDGTEQAKYVLSSPGVSVCWHRKQSQRLMVAEKCGVIRFYNVTTNQPLRSLTSPVSPLLDADWCILDSKFVGCVAGTEWLAWDIERSSFPQERNGTYTDQGTGFKWSGCSSNIVATTGHHGKTVKVINANRNQTLLSLNMSVSSKISWHHIFPVLAISGDRCINIWTMDTV